MMRGKNEKDEGDLKPAKSKER